MNIIVFSSINFELASINQTSLKKQQCTHKNACYKLLVHTFLHSLRIERSVSACFFKFNFFLISFSNAKWI